MKGERKERPAEKAARNIKQEQRIANADAIPEDVARHWSEFGHTLDFLPEIADKVRELQATIAECETEKKELLGVIEASLDALDIRTVRGDNWVAVKVAGGTTKKIVPELLVEAGVTIEQLKAATVEQPRKGYTQVRKLEVAE